MSDQNKHDAAGGAEVEDATATGEGPAAQGGDADASGPAADGLEARLEAALAEIETLKDQALRSQAEAENVRRRSARDVENAHKFALEKFLGELLPVVDSLEKGLDSARKTADEAAEGPARDGAAAMAEGVALSLKLFAEVIGKAGIEPIDPLGEPFDPQRHEAMAMIENPDAEPNTVLDVMQKGYSLNGRIVRAAMVVVSKGA